jgi:hypothetical protein
MASADGKLVLVELSEDHARFTRGTLDAYTPGHEAEVMMVPSGPTWLSDYCTVLSNAVNGGATVINFPQGMDLPGWSNQWWYAFEHARQSNVLVIASAPHAVQPYDAGQFCTSNQYGSFCSAVRDWPAMFGFSNVLVVAGHGVNGEPWYGSSTQYFTFCAPSREVRTVGGTWQGNSAAAAYTSAAAVRIMQQHGSAEVRQRLLDGLDVEPRYSAHVMTSGRLNVERSLGEYRTLSVQRGASLTNFQDRYTFKVLTGASQDFFRVWLK